jgi:hypothetical protein
MIYRDITTKIYVYPKKTVIIGLTLNYAKRVYKIITRVHDRRTSWFSSR